MNNVSSRNPLSNFQTPQTGEVTRTFRPEVAKKLAELQPLLEQRFSPEEIQAFQEYLSQAAETSQVMPTAWTARLEELIPKSPLAEEVEAAATSNPQDSASETESKNQYATLFRQVRRATTQAERLINQHGLGVHEQEKQTVKIIQEPSLLAPGEGGSSDETDTVVSILKKDGTEKVIRLVGNHNDGLELQTLGSDGASETLFACGSDLVHSTREPDGSEASKKYGLSEGRKLQSSPCAVAGRSIFHGIAPGRNRSGLPPGARVGRAHRKPKPELPNLPSERMPVTHFTVSGVQVSMTRLGKTGNAQSPQDSYLVQVPGSSFTLNIDSNTPDQAAQVKLILEEYLKIPTPLRGVLKVLNLKSGPSPDDDYWAKKFNTPGFTSAASAGQGTINIFNGGVVKGANQIAHALSHEFGHLVGEAIQSGQLKFPPGWEDAVKSDPPMEGVKTTSNGKVVNYSQMNPNEDFAESFKYYLQAFQQGRKALQAFAAKYPNRAKILEKIFAGQMELKK